MTRVFNHTQDAGHPSVHIEVPHDLRDRLQAHVQHLAGDIGPRHMARPDAWQSTVTYIHRALGDAAGPVSIERFSVGQQQADNLIVEWPGLDASAPTLIVAAHYDTVPNSPGADDNASAVAALIEIARMLANFQPRRTLRLIAFANEEEPHEQQGTMGSQAHARRCRERSERVEMIALEMLGYYDSAKEQRYPFPLTLARGTLLPRRADFVAMVSNLRSAGMLRRFARAFPRSHTLPVVAWPLPHLTRLIRRSDHGPFWDQGFRAFMVTDTSFLRNPHYHQPSDEPDTLNYDRLADVTAGLCRAIAAYCGQ